MKSLWLIPKEAGTQHCQWTLDKQDLLQKPSDPLKVNHDLVTTKLEHGWPDRSSPSKLEDGDRCRRGARPPQAAADAETRLGVSR